MTNFETISPKNNIPKPSSRETLSHKGLARRNILKGLAAASALAVVGSKAIKLIKKNECSTPTFSDEKQKKLDAAIARIVAGLNPTETQKEIGQRDLSIIGKTFAEQIESGKDIELDQATRNAIYKHHYDEYCLGGINYEGNIVKGLERMNKWVSEIKEKFSDCNIDKKFIYLAIAESGFRIKAVSPDAAVGPYQIIPKTAIDYGLIMTKFYDERLDPIRSAELCANYLKNSLKKSNGDESFALMDYNGGYTKQYLLSIIKNEKRMQANDINPQKNSNGTVKEHTVLSGETLEVIAKKYNTSVTRLAIKNKIKNAYNLTIGKKLQIPEGRKITFDGFNAWLEHRINIRIKEESGKYKYIVHSGDTLGVIAKNYNEDYRTIMILNNLQTPSIKVGQKLRIPSLEKKRKEKILKILSDYKENINYPDKFYAIFDIIKQEKLLEQFDNATTTYTEVRPPGESFQEFHYTIQSGDNLPRIAHLLKNKNPKCSLTINQLVSMLVEQNGNIPNKHSIRAGSSIALRFPLKLTGSLMEIAKERGFDIDILKDLNPAVLDEFVSLPKNARIRVPKNI